MDSSSSSSEEESDQQDTYAERLAKSPKIAQSTVRCAVCEGHHPTERCGILAKMEPDGKVRKLAEKKLCFQCLEPGHSARRCQREKPFCIMCHKSHQTILHGRTYPTSSPKLSADNNDRRGNRNGNPANTTTTPGDGAGESSNPTNSETPSL